MAKEVKHEVDLNLSDSAFPVSVIATFHHFQDMLKLQMEAEKIHNMLEARLKRMEVEREKVRIGEYTAFCNYFKTHFEYVITEKEVSDLVLSGLTLEAISKQILEEIKRKDSESLTDLDQEKLKQQALEHEDHIKLETERLAFESAKRQQEIRRLPFEQQLSSWTENDMICHTNNGYRIISENVLAFVTSAKTKEQRIAMLTWFIEVAHSDFKYEDMLRKKVFRILGIQGVSHLAEYIETLKK